MKSGYIAVYFPMVPWVFDLSQGVFGEIILWILLMPMCDVVLMKCTWESGGGRKKVVWK